MTLQDRVNGTYCMKDDCICDLNAVKIKELKTKYNMNNIITPDATSKTVKKALDCPK